MKKRIVLLLLCVCAISILVQAQGIQFETGTWKQALQKAKKEKKTYIRGCVHDMVWPL